MARAWERLYLHEKPVSHTSVSTACGCIAHECPHCLSPLLVPLPPGPLRPCRGCFLLQAGLGCGAPVRTSAPAGLTLSGPGLGCSPGLWDLRGRRGPGESLEPGARPHHAHRGPGPPQPLGFLELEGPNWTPTLHTPAPGPSLCTARRPRQRPHPSVTTGSSLSVRGQTPTPPTWPSQVVGGGAPTQLGSRGPVAPTAGLGHRPAQEARPSVNA